MPISKKTLKKKLKVMYLNKHPITLKTHKIINKMVNNIIEKMIDKLVQHEINKVKGGDASTNVVNTGTKIIEGIQKNVLYNIPEVGKVLKFIGDNAENVVDKIFGIKSQLLPSAQFREKYGNTFNDYQNIIEKYGINSDIAKTFKSYYPNQTTQGEYIYNNQNDPSSGLKYPKNLQDAYMKIQNLGNSNYRKNATAIAKSYGLNWDDPKVIDMYRQLYLDHSYLGNK